MERLGKKVLLELRVGLARRIAEKAIIQDPETGYIFCPEVNHLVVPEILQNAAEVVMGLFLDSLPSELKPQKVVGVSNRGKEFATTLGLKTNLPIAVTERKLQGEIKKISVTADYDQERDLVKINNVPSFTRKTNFAHLLYGVKPDENVIVVDDFCAHGHVADAFWQGLRQLKINPIFAFLVAKDFSHLQPPQVGYRRLKEKGIPVFAVVRLTGIENGMVIATAEDINR